MTMETGSTFMWWSDTPPAGCLVCDGSTYLKSTYPELAAVLGATFSVDATNFVVPDMRDRVPVCSSSTRAINDHGGADSVTLTKDQLPPHEHYLSRGAVNTYQITNAFYPGGNSIGTNAFEVGNQPSWLETTGGNIFPFAQNLPVDIQQKHITCNYVIQALAS